MLLFNILHYLLTVLGMSWVSGVVAFYLQFWLVLPTGSALKLACYEILCLFVTNQIYSLSYWHISSPVDDRSDHLLLDQHNLLRRLDPQLFVNLLSWPECKDIYCDS
ncbi:hypothetical protein QQ045_029264 [Rhodiola kirilowii]